MTWDEICALDVRALNEAIDTHIYQHEWERCHEEDRVLWFLRDIHVPDYEGIRGTYRTVRHLHYTADWGHTMKLAWAWHVRLTPLWDAERGVWSRWVIDTRCYDERYSHAKLYAHAEEEARVAICRLALWHKIGTREGEV